MIEAPAYRVAKMSVILIGTSAAGCILGAWMTGAIGKNKTEVFQETNNNELATKKDTVALFVQAEKEKWAPVEARDKEIFRWGQLIRELRQQLKDREQELEAWEEWLDLVHRLDKGYEVFGCKGCRYFVGSEDGGNFFVCAMHPYGKRCCEDRE